MLDLSVTLLGLFDQMLKGVMMTNQQNRDDFGGPEMATNQFLQQGCAISLASMACGEIWRV